MRIDFAPLVARPEAVLDRALLVDQWLIEGTEEGWDYHNSINARRSLEVFPQKLADILELPASGHLRVVASWNSSLGPLLGGSTAFNEIALSEEHVEIPLSLEIPGVNAGGTLSLSTMICLGRGCNARVGTEVWSDQLTIPLDQLVPRIPVAIVHFSEFPARFSRTSALWSVEVMPEGYDLPVSTGVQIFLNASQTDFIKQITESPDGISQLWFNYEVGRSLIFRAVLDEVFDLEADYQAGTVGRSLATKIKALFPGVTQETLRAQAITQPHEFDATLQAHLLRRQ